MFSKKMLMKSINHKCDYHCNGYIQCALNQIDRALDEAVVDDDFYNEFFKLKRNLEFYNMGHLPIVVSFSVSMVTTMFSDLAENWILWVTLIAAFIGLLACYFVVRQLWTKQGCVLEPYLLKKMEEKIVMDRESKTHSV